MMTKSLATRHLVCVGMWGHVHIHITNIYTSHPPTHMHAHPPTHNCTINNTICTTCSLCIVEYMYLTPAVSMARSPRGACKQYNRSGGVCALCVHCGCNQASASINKPCSKHQSLKALVMNTLKLQIFQLHQEHIVNTMHSWLHTKLLLNDMICNSALSRGSWEVCFFVSSIE